MPSPHSTFSEIVTTTFRKHSKQLKDNTSKHVALLRQLEKAGRTERVDGGYSLVEELDYGTNSTYTRYSNWDVLNTSQSDVITAAEFQWRNIAIAVVSSGNELRINKGESRITNLAVGKIKNAMRSFRNNFSADLYSDGSLPNQVNGVQALINDLGTGTVGGIDSSVWQFWRNKVQSAAAPIQGGGAVTVSATTIEGQMMLPLYVELTRQGDTPDMIVMSNDYYIMFESSQAALKRYVDEGSADAGFRTLAFHNARVYHDGGSGIPAARAYFINTDYLKLKVHEDADMEPLEGTRPYNQDGEVRLMLWMGNLCVSNRSLQGVMKP